jgi:hypothetical protein
MLLGNINAYHLHFQYHADQAKIFHQSLNKTTICLIKHGCPTLKIGSKTQSNVNYWKKS